MELKIAICDDELKYRRLVHEMILKDGFMYDYELEISEFACGDEVLEAVDNGTSFDVYFLDIQTDKGTDDGIRLARKLRQRGEKGLIVYVTSFIDYVQTGYEVKAFRYLLKNQIEEKLSEVLCDIRKEFAGEEYFSFQIAGETIRINKALIMYFESDRRQLKLIAGSGEEYCFYKSMDDVQKELGETFLRCHRSYMVNMSYIKGWSGERIELKCGTVIPISRSHAKTVKQKLMLELV